MSRPSVSPWRVTRAFVAPALFAAALTGCADQASPTPRSTGVKVAVPLAAPAAVRTETPRLLRGGSMPAIAAATPADAALAHARALAPQWGAAAGLADLAPIATLPVTGGNIVRIRQSLDGVPVERGELRVLVGPGGTLVAASGMPAAADLPRDLDAFTTGAVHDGQVAVARAVAAVHQVAVGPGAFRARAGASEAADPASWFTGDAAGVHVSEARARRAWYRDGDALTAAWIVEAYTSPAGSTDAALHRVLVAARNGRVIEQRNLTVDAAFDYRVWAETTGDLRPLDGPVEDFSPHPTGMPGGGRPAYIPPSLVTVDGLNHNPSDGFDPWLPAGATETSGNNVDAYTDINSPNGLSAGDFRASTTATGVFDRVYDTAASPIGTEEQQMAAIAQLFYSINWLHDTWYDAGLTEAAGNGQADNFGRGGVAGDPLLAEAQDGANAGRRNNANMSTPDDGMNPRMQVYLWTGDAEENLTLSSTSATLVVSTASYGPSSYDVTANVVAGTDGTGTSMTDGCEPITNNVAGLIVLLDRGNCTFKTKTRNVQNANGVGMILANNQGTSPPPLSNDTSITDPITIPSMGISMAAGADLRTALGNGAVSATLYRLASVETDGALDGPLVAHEFGHYVHHRLSVCGTIQCGGMSEGWGDFLSLHLLARPGDDLHGTYAISGYAYNGDPYFGIRRAPYSVDTTKNAFTFELVADGTPLPSSHPIQGFGVNSEVHNAGEVWAQAMWEVYVALLEVPGADFAATRAKMARYVVSGLSMAPPDGTFTEIRDSILTAAHAASPADHDVMTAAFARRGLGSCAVSPPRESDDNVGAVEDFTVSGRALPGDPVLTFTSDCDADGAFDVGDTATITVPVVNASAMALSGDVQVTVTSSNPGLTVSAPVSLGALGAYADGTATFDVTATADLGAGPGAATFEITVAATGCTPPTHRLSVLVQADVAPASSATDTFDAVPSAWVRSGDNSDLVWAQTVEAGIDRRWSGADVGTTVDASLESPEMIASATEPVVVSFDHSYEFEFSQNTYWDGGVIEITTDGGATWNDVSTLVTPGYTGTLGGDSGNPLDGRDVYGATNPSYPATDHVSLDFGTSLAERSFKLRFRIATDGAVGATGWRIDDVAVTGITNTPFPALIGETSGASCAAGPDAGTGPGEEPGGCCSSGGPRPGDFAAGLLALAFLLRRRASTRRKAPRSA